jgi:enediyne biosynthesis protein E4
MPTSRLASTLSAMLFATCSTSAHIPQEAPPKPGPQAPPVHTPPPTDTAQLIERAREMLLIRGFVQGAEIALQAVLDKEPQNARALMLMGLVNQKLKRYDRARELFNQSLDLKQEFPERRHTWHFLGWANYYLGDLEEAKKAFAEHLKGAPTEGDSMFGLGVIALDEDDLPEAEKQLLAAIEVQADNPKRQGDVAKARARLGQVYERQAAFDKAEHQMRLATTMAPDLYEAWFMLETLYRRLDRQADAEEARQQGVAARQRLHPDLPIVADDPAATQPATQPAPAATQPTTRPATAPASDIPSLGFRFTDVTAASGLHMTVASGATPSTQVLEVKGGGLGVIDFDNDGDLDVFIPNGATMADPEHGPGARLYENLGNLTFRDVTAASGIDHHRWSFGVAVGDYDGDGLDDLYVCCYGPDVLWRNLGRGRFENATAAAHLGDESHWSAFAAFGDLDNDGDLDLYVVNYLEFDVAKRPLTTHFKGVEVMSGPFGLAAAPDLLYENLGDGTFRNVSELSGIAAVRPAYGLNVAILDFDGDHLADLFVGNDSQANNLFRNLGGFKFKDVGREEGVATNSAGAEQATMGVAIADVDGNGRPDLYTTNFSSDSDTLHLNMPRPSGVGSFFNDRTQAYGFGQVTAPFLGWACAFQDFDHDADEDLLVFHGHVYPQATRQTMDSDYRQTPLLFERAGRRFKRVEASVAGAWLDEAHLDRSAVFADFDHDGDVDFIVTELNGPVRVLRNDVNPPADRWLVVSLADPRPGIHNRHGIGAKVEARTGDTTQSRWLVGGGPFQSNAPPRVHFGLGPGVNSVDLVVTWPGGEVQTVAGAAPGRIVRIERGVSPNLSK